MLERWKPQREPPSFYGPATGRAGFPLFLSPSRQYRHTAHRAEKDYRSAPAPRCSPLPFAPLVLVRPAARVRAMESATVSLQRFSAMQAAPPKIGRVWKQKRPRRPVSCARHHGPRLLLVSLAERGSAANFAPVENAFLRQPKGQAGKTKNASLRPAQSAKKTAISHGLFFFRCPEAEPLAGAVVTQLPSCHAEPATQKKASDANRY